MLVKLEFTREGIRLLNTLDDPEVLLDAGTFTQLLFSDLWDRHSCSRPA